MTKHCSIEGCEGTHAARGWCSMHYQRAKKHGDPLWEPPTLRERFEAKVERIEGGCYLWTGSLTEGGYGKFSLGGHDGGWALAHRVAWELYVGPIPKGKELDHVKERGCTNRHCVNTEHLEPVTSRENLARTDAWKCGPRPHRQKTHCIHGHEFTPENTVMDSGGKRCLTCRRIRDRARRAKAR